MPKKLFTLLLSVIALCCFTNQASAGQLMSKTKVSKVSEKEEAKKASATSDAIMKSCIDDDHDYASLRKVCFSAQAHTKMTIRLIRRATELYGKQASKDDIIDIFATHISVVKSLNTSATKLNSLGANQAKQGIFEWHTLVMDEVRGCIEKDKTLVRKLFTLHAEAAKVIFE